MVKRTKTHAEIVEAFMDQLANAVTVDRLSAAFIVGLESEPFSEIAEWAEQLTDIAQMIESALSYLEEWRDADDRDAKREAKESALEQIDNLVSAWTNHPLDLNTLEAWTPEEDV